MQSSEIMSMDPMALIEHFSNGIIGVQTLLMSLQTRLDPMGWMDFVLHLNDTGLTGEALWNRYKLESGLEANPDATPDMNKFIAAIKTEGARKGQERHFGSQRSSSGYGNRGRRHHQPYQGRRNRW